MTVTRELSAQEEYIHAISVVCYEGRGLSRVQASAWSLNQRVRQPTLTGDECNACSRKVMFSEDKHWAFQLRRPSGRENLCPQCQGPRSKAMFVLLAVILPVGPTLYVQPHSIPPVQPTREKGGPQLWARRASRSGRIDRDRRCRPLMVMAMSHRLRPRHLPRRLCRR